MKSVTVVGVVKGEIEGFWNFKEQSYFGITVTNC